ncbi:MAG: outer membrane protein transport protein [Bacteroidaceae bacterium]|nr:outer membrane protein transport protein [Bacteroidaceae bacterium]
MLNCRKLIAVLWMAVTVGTALGQTNGSNSPYSRYGFGLLSDRAGGFNKAMAGVGYAMADGKELNVKNPASYAYIDSLSFLFDIGLSVQNANFSTGGQSVNAKNTSLDYVNMGFRLSPNLGISLGLMPFSTIGYSTTTTSTLKVATGDVVQSDGYAGDGGLHEVYFGVGWRPAKYISIGANVGYLWGDLSHTVLTSFSDANIQSLRRHYETDMRTYKADFGLLYHQPLNKKNNLLVGLTYGLGHNIKSKAVYHNQKIASGTVTAGDTLKLANAYQLPHTLGAGMVWEHNGRLRLGLDYTWQKWSSVKFPTLAEHNGTLEYKAAKGGFSDRHSVGMGCEYIPNPMGLRWRNHVRYRAGFSYSTPYAKIDGRDGPRSYCVSLGVGLPILNRYTNRPLVNISAQYERVEPKVAGMITENYLRLCVGISFNERWFMKWKVQ